MSENIKNDLILKLKEIFRSDRSDLDFGIYRILNFRRKEIDRFIEEDLVKQAEAEFSELVKANFEEQKADLDTLRDEINRDFPEGTIDERGEVRRLYDAPKIKRYIELKQSIDDQRQVQTQINEVFNHVYEFFSRYYDKGDFISQRWFGGRGKYVIPHNGEEVSLYWVNQDQYYIKTSEDYRKYSFNSGDHNITFKLVDAESEKNNNVGADSFFVIHRELPVRFDEENKRLEVFFEHRPLTEEDLDFYEIGKSSQQNTKFTTIIEKDYETVLKSLRDYPELIGKITSSKHNDGEKPELKHHLIQYYRKNDMDYFIHKRLGEFLRRELDFYIKNEVLDLDETISKDAKNIKLTQLKIGAIKKISDRIITFLAQIEDFQKKLWNKKKFIISTDYNITLDYIDKKYYPKILENKGQLEEWKKLYAFDLDKEINTLGGKLLWTRKSEEEKKIELLKQNPTLTIDTKFYDFDFKYHILGEIDYLDEKISGILINSENYQALNLLSTKYKEEIKCCYIDPPFNTGDSRILYKNRYLKSSWLSLIENRMSLAMKLLTHDAVCFVAIDDFEMVDLCEMIDTLYPNMNRDMIIVNHHPQGGKATTLANTHEYMLVLIDKEVRKTLVANKSGEEIEHRPFKRSGTAESNFRYGRPNSFYAILIDQNNTVVGLESPPNMNTSYPKYETSEGYTRIYPIGKDNSERVWRRSYESGLTLVAEGKLICSDNGTIYQIIQNKDRTPALFSNWTSKKYNAGTYGANLLRDIIGEQNPFPYPKSIYTVFDALYSIQDKNGIYLDYFAGSGTTGHAVIKLNKKDNGDRKFILVEMGQYFDSITKQRILKVIYSDNWKEGKPLDNDGTKKQIIKYMYLEQYEDTLNNILFSDKGGFAQTTLHKLPDYFLQHVLNVETKDSLTRLTVDKFKTPFDYKIKTLQGREEKTEPVDLVETFNYLLGIRVKKIRQYENEQTKYVIVYGEKGEEPACTKVLIIWRNYNENILEKEKQFIEQKIIPQFNPDIIYVNVDSLIKGAESIEPKFKELMRA